MINVTKPTSLIFTPEVISFILDSLAERPFRLANPIIQDIFTQLRSQEAKENTERLREELKQSNGEGIPVQ